MYVHTCNTKERTSLVMSSMCLVLSPTQPIWYQ